MTIPDWIAMPLFFLFAGGATIFSIAWLFAYIGFLSPWGRR